MYEDKKCFWDFDKETQEKITALKVQIESLKDFNNFITESENQIKEIRMRIRIRSRDFDMESFVCPDSSELKSLISSQLKEIRLKIAELRGE